MLRSLITAAVAVVALLVTAPAASAAGPDDILSGFLEGIGAAFGSSSSKPHPKAYSQTFPDGPSCQREAQRLRKPGVTVECNPLGGTGGGYQLVYIP